MTQTTTTPDQAAETMTAALDAINEARKAAKTQSENERLGDELFKLAESVAFRAYRMSIKQTIADLIEDSGPDQDVGDAICEAAYGDYRVIYTHQAKRLLLLSENAGAAEEEGIECDNENRRAFYALRADLYEELTSTPGYEHGNTFGECFPGDEDEDEADE